jgi:HK97 family phage portal protein
MMAPLASPTPRNYTHMVREGYMKNVIVYRCVSLVARSLASVPLEVEQTNKDRFEQHDMLRIFAGSNFLERIVTTLLLSGNAPVVILRDPLRLMLLRPDALRFDDEKEAYFYQVSENKIYLSQDKFKTNKIFLQNIRLPHPLTDKMGFAPLEAAALSVDQHNAVSQHNLAVLQNGGRPFGALMVKTPHGIPLDEKEREAFKDTLRQTYSGPKNAGKILLLEGEMSWQEMGLSLKDLDFVEGKHMCAREIAQAFGVPTMLVGVPGESTFANYKEARFHLWEDTILPLLDLVLRALNEALSDEFDGAKIVYDIQRIPALSQKRETLWKTLESASFLTNNEKREALGYGPLETS